MWARMKSELLYGHYETENMSTDESRPSSGDSSSATGIIKGSVQPIIGFWDTNCRTEE